MIKNDKELATTLERVRWIQSQLATLRKVETNLVNYRLSASGFPFCRARKSHWPFANQFSLVV